MQAGLLHYLPDYYLPTWQRSLRPGWDLNAAIPPWVYCLPYLKRLPYLYKLNVPLLPRILTEQAHSKTGIDIHPAAAIGEHFFIDHGTGIVIGETAKIGNHVKLYQGVTLGALSVSKELAFTKRHPTVEDHGQ